MNIDWSEVDRIKVTGTSLTTGGKKKFILNEKQWSRRFTHYPAWSFDLSTIAIVRHKEVLTL